jgi:hypothetical protein
MIYVSISYSERKPFTYRAVVLSIDEAIQEFNSGDFIKDWYHCMMAIINQDKREVILYSSSVDNFIIDTKEYRSAYLTIVENKAILSYKYMNDEKDKVELFVKEDEEPTWEELKQYCEGGSRAKSKKKKRG